MRRFSLLLVLIFSFYLIYDCQACTNPPVIVSMPDDTETQVGQTVYFEADAVCPDHIDGSCLVYMWEFPSGAYYIHGNGTPNVKCKFDAAGEDYSVSLRVKCQTTGLVSIPDTVLIDVLDADSLWYVRADGNDDNDGQSNSVGGSPNYEGAFRTIQTAIDSASDEDEIIVAEGTYRETISLKGKKVTVRSTDPENWSVVENTIINGHGQGAVVSFEGSESTDCLFKGFTVMGGGNSYEDPLDDYLEGQWELNEINGTETPDSSENGNVGTLLPTGSGPTLDSNGGRIGGCFVFNGANYVQMNNYYANEITGSQARTTCAWIKLSPGSTGGNILSYGGSAYRASWLLMVNGDKKLQLGVNGGNIIGNQVLEVDRWYHVAAVLDDWDRDGLTISDLRLYIDGEQVSGAYVNSNETLYTGDTYPIRIGTHISVSYFFNGRIDDVRLYSKALTESEIQSLAGDPGKVAHWKLDDGSGTAATDSSGNGYTGTRVNDPDWDTGKLDNCLTFNGTNEEYVEVTDYKGISGSQARTTCAWIQTTQGGMVLHYGSHNPGEGWLLLLNTNGTLQIGVIGTANLIGTQNILGQWHHVAAVLDDYNGDGSMTVEDLRLYIDGQSETGTYNNPNMVINTTDDYPVRIGAYEDSGGIYNFFTGQIDDVRLYDRALTEVEIRSLYTQGGGIYGNDTQAVISNCAIRNNQTPFEGGGIWNVDGTITNCFILNNESQSNGGGLADCDGDIVNCVIANNEASDGGGLINCDGDITNCTIVYNTTDISVGGIKNCDGSVTNTILWGNSDSDPGTNVQQSQIKDCTATVTYSCIQDDTPGATPIYIGTGNIDEDPLFINSSIGDYHLGQISSCRNTGDPKTNYDNQTDIDGGLRVFSWGTDRVDMGADEWYPSNSNSWYVNATASAGGNGSPSLPFNKIQDAVNAASDWDIIILSEGIYTGAGNRDIDFGGKAITVRSTNPEDWAVVANTIINCQGSSSVPHRGFYFHSGESNDSVVSGLTITGGYGKQIDYGEFEDWYSGGGIYCETGSSPTISYCLITGNTCADPIEALEDGGGIACFDGSDAQILNCIITDNSAEYSGGVSCFESSPIIKNCVITNNTAFQVAGIGAWEGAAQIINCTIFNNDATDNSSGAGLNIYPGIVTNCILWDNSSAGIDTQLSQVDYVTNSNMTYCCIEGWTGTMGSPTNFGENPSFVNILDLNGEDSIWGTEDDGLHLTIGSSCIDTANGDAASMTDILKKERIDIVGYNGGVGNPSFADIGAYEMNRHFPYNNRTGEVYFSIQEAINSSTTTNGDIIILSEGIYTGEGNRDIDFGGKAITVRGTNPEDWAAVANTIINCQGSSSVPHRGFYFHSGESNDSVVSGLTITGGYGKPGITWTEFSSGGGILCEDGSSPTISYCLITGNTCPEEVGDGGGIACYDGSGAQIYNCFIMGNHAEYAGGISCYENDNLTIENCVIANNTAALGAGIVAYEGVTHIINCTIYNNDMTDAGSGAGLNIYPGIVTNCILWDNSSAGIDTQLSQVDYVTNSNMTYCCIEGWTGTMGSPTNFALDPSFINSTDPDGEDNIWGTEDDGLQLGTGSSCIDAANGDAAPIKDILKKEPFDVPNIPNIGTGEISGITYVDLGAYESYADTDGDGLPDAWEKYYWPNDELSVHDSTTDSDDDGISDRIEYLFETDPTDENSGQTTMIGYYIGGYTYAPIVINSARLLVSECNPVTASSDISFDFCLNKDCDINVIFKRTDQTWSNPVRTIEIRNEIPGQKAVQAGEPFTVAWDGRDDIGRLVERYFYDIKIVEVGNPVPLWISELGANSSTTTGMEGHDFTGFNPFKNIPAEIKCYMYDYVQRTIRVRTYPDNNVVKTICNQMIGKGWNTFYWSGYNDTGNLHYGYICTIDFEIPTPVLKGATLIYYDALLSNIKCNPYRLISSGDEVTTITYTLAYDSNVTVKVYDNAGLLFATVASEFQSAGPQSLTWNGKSDTGECITNEGAYRIEVQIDETNEILEGTITVYK